jgi:3-oxoacyl-(acyl-carrier-protein) synthase
MESLGGDLALVQKGDLKLGVILCVTSGCVTYTRRFYDEVLKAPATASPVIFPETVFNAPASHIAAVLGTTAPAYTLLGDQGTFLTALALAADWLQQGIVDGCVVVAAEELDWLRAYAIELLDRQLFVSEGAGALYLSSTGPQQGLVEVSAITDPQFYTNLQSKSQAVLQARAELGRLSEGTLLCDGLQGSPRTDQQEAEAWASWHGPRISPKRILGEALMASAAWQCIAVADLVQRQKYPEGVVSVAGCNEQAIMAQLVPSS